ncbi:DUF1501 domain-containing protein [Arenicella xantha]|uniref:Uncharacterized protein DUF1501 n=1 Tax=Arenicella xantha TaxID=644221 RepID=A0A395JJ86_9GAMM|nr:DUF1501 domain-containing protein [Arenicella xantha]RBP50751.1 uncharacterized protein DUF1501 [Arenicella xantha]
MKRREFIQSLAAALAAASLPSFSQSASAAGCVGSGFEPLNQRALINIMLGGGPDFRHFIVPGMPGVDGVLVPTEQRSSFAYLYWKYRSRAHRTEVARGGFASDDAHLIAQEAAWRARWNDHYEHFDTATFATTANNVGDPIYVGPSSSTTEFGIWHGAGWLIRMFKEGKVAICANMVGATHRAHDHAVIQLDQGNILSNVDDGGRSGWGGRLATAAGGASVALTETPSPFTFGPVTSPVYEPNLIDNSNLVAIRNSRDLGLREHDLDQDQSNRADFALARTLKSYYGSLQQETLNQQYDKPLAHEQRLRVLGQQMSTQLNFNVPDEIRALYAPTLDRSKDPMGSAEEFPTHDFNDDVNGVARHVCFDQKWGEQIRNLYDVLAANCLLDLKVASLQYTLEWDSHSQQRKNMDVPDLQDPYINRGIESAFQDVFGGPQDELGAELHYGLSALWKHLDSTTKQNLVFVAAGEFGRQIRDNGDSGTDHGAGNIMLVFGESVNGGVYGELFQDDEIAKYTDAALFTPDITPRTEFDHLFASVCEAIAPTSGSVVFPRVAPDYTGEAPILEQAQLFDNLFKSNV